MTLSAAAPEPKVHTPRVLVVDDQPLNLKLMERILQESGYLVDLAHSGHQCLEKVEEHPPDIILLDIMMPEMDGLEVCQKLRAHKATQATPIIFITAKATKEDKLEGLNAGAIDYITKPVDPDELQARIKTQLEYQRAHRLNLELERRLEEVRRAVTIGAVTEGIAHNLNNIIAGSLGYLEVIHQLADNPEKVRECCHIVQGSLTRMSEIIKKLRQVTDRDPLDMSLTHFKALLVRTLEAFEVGHPGIMPLEVHFEGAIDADTTFHTDTTIFEDVMHRLLKNAFESYPSSTPLNKRWISIRVHPSELQGMPALSIGIEDRGQGIDPHLKDTLFEPFVSGHAEIGRGLGLTIARQAVESLRGELRIVNNPQGGVCATWVHIV